MLTGRAVDGATPTVRPEAAGFWTKKVDGGGEQELRIRIDDVQQAIVIAPRTTGSLTLVQVGLTLRGLFHLVLLVGGIALAVLVLCLWFERRHRRQRPAQSAPRKSGPVQREPAKPRRGVRKAEPPPRRRAKREGPSRGAHRDRGGEPVRLCRAPRTGRGEGPGDQAGCRAHRRRHPGLRLRPPGGRGLPAGREAQAEPEGLDQGQPRSGPGRRRVRVGVRPGGEGEADGATAGGGGERLRPAVRQLPDVGVRDRERR